MKDFLGLFLSDNVTSLMTTFGSPKTMEGEKKVNKMDTINLKFRGMIKDVASRMQIIQDETASVLNILIYIEQKMKESEKP